MAADQPDDVAAAFDMLIEEIEGEIGLVNHTGARAFEARDYELAKSALERAAAITTFRDQVDTLRREWDSLAKPQTKAPEGVEARDQRRNFGRLTQGLRTPEQAYFRPILQTLVELGGQAEMRVVLDRVGQRMAGILRDVDYQPMASHPDTPRWENAAQWARHSMVREGLMRRDTPRGVWGIAEAGRRFLQEAAA